MRRAASVTVILMCLTAFLPVALRAQYPKVAKQKPGSLEGEVVNAKGAPVSDAQIMWQSADGETPHLLHSDAHGRFHVDPLRAGLYDLRASSSGIRSDWEHNVIVHPGAAAHVILRLKLKDAPAPAH